jgi:hypothetical protein
MLWLWARETDPIMLYMIRGPMPCMLFIAVFIFTLLGEETSTRLLAWIRSVLCWSPFPGVGLTGAESTRRTGGRFSATTLYEMLYPLSSYRGTIGSARSWEVNKTREIITCQHHHCTLCLTSTSGCSNDWISGRGGNVDSRSRDIIGMYQRRFLFLYR